MLCCMLRGPSNRSALQVCVFHGFYTWLLYTVAGVHMPYTATLVSVVAGVIPFFPAWLIAIAGALTVCCLCALFVPGGVRANPCLSTNLAALRAPEFRKCSRAAWRRARAGAVQLYTQNGSILLALGFWFAHYIGLW